LVNFLCIGYFQILGGFSRYFNGYRFSSIVIKEHILLWSFLVCKFLFKVQCMFYFECVCILEQNIHSAIFYKNHLVKGGGWYYIHSLVLHWFVLTEGSGSRSYWEMVVKISNYSCFLLYFFNFASYILRLCYYNNSSGWIDPFISMIKFPLAVVITGKCFIWCYNSQFNHLLSYVNANI
jgi:hypothetical protein